MCVYLCFFTCMYTYGLLPEIKHYYYYYYYLKRSHVRCPSILKKIAMYSCAHVAHSRTISINPSAC